MRQTIHEDTRTESRKHTKWLEWATVGWLFVFAAFAPHSIAITQTAWLLGMFFWLGRFIFRPRPRPFRTPIDFPLLGFFILTGISSFLSYEPLTSIGKLRAASLFTIIYLFAQNIPSRRVLRSLALTLVISAALGTVYTFGERIVGRGVKLGVVAENSPLSSATWTSERKTIALPIRSGDTILEVDGKRVRDLSELADALTGSASSGKAWVKVYRAEWIGVLEVPRGNLLPGSTAEENLGVSSWSTGRDWRATGLYGLYVSYAEALQLILALAVGMFICMRSKRCLLGGLWLLIVLALGAALVLTFTRASWLAFLISSAVILLLSVSRRTIVVASVVAIPLILVGLFLLQQYRKVGFLDRTDQSTTWRETVWLEGTALLVSKPRHLLIGIGMDSIKRRWRQWGLFEGGRLPWGHMHSNPLQIALERGVPALILWLIFLGVYARTLWRMARDKLIDHWVERGVVLGALGGLCGFFVSGLVHYNWGDSEVIMIFYCIIGLTISIKRLAEP